MEIILDSHMRVHKDYIENDWINPLIDTVSVVNEEKVVAMKEKIRGATHMPDKIPLGGFDGDYFVAPRGFYNEFKEKLEKFGVELTTKDLMVYNEEYGRGYPITQLREDQLESYDAIVEGQQGIANMSTGFGKTVVALYTAHVLGQKTLVLVNKISLATQWIERCREHIGEEMGLIGDGKWEDSGQFTVATLQTLHSRKDELDESDWWSRFGFVAHDESHHISGDTYYDVVNKFPAAFRIGFSATLGKSKEKARVAEITFGPVIYQNLEIKDKPQLVKVETEFRFDFEGTKFVNGRRVQNNYSKLLKSLVEDDERNRLVAKKVASDPKAAHLVVSRRLAHLENIKRLAIEYGFPADRCFMLTGKETLEERENVSQEAAHGGVAIFSTIADEGLDIPRLDRIHLPFPTKDAEAVKQQVGRGLRRHPDKTECIVYDYVDNKCSVLNNQFRKRTHGYYNPNGIYSGKALN